MKLHLLSLAALVLVATASCKKQGCTDPAANNYSDEARKDDGSCAYDTPAPAYTVPATFAFTDPAGNSTVNYDGQKTRLEQLTQMMVYVKSGKDAILDASAIQAMFENTGGNGNGYFTGIAAADATKQLKDKCFSPDVALMESFFTKAAVASASFNQTAADGQAGTLVSGSSEYLFDENGIEYAQLIEKILMGAVFENQALNVYFGPGKMDVDNSTPVSGKFYTQMEHHWDEAFGYFGAPIDFPSNTAGLVFWAKYSNSQNANLGSNDKLMGQFLKGRAAISANVIADRDAAIQSIRETWESVAAYQAMTYLDQAISSFGTDQAKFLHVLSEAYAFTYCLRYSPVETRNITPDEVTAIINMFGTNFWEITLADLNDIKAAIDANY